MTLSLKQQSQYLYDIDCPLTIERRGGDIVKFCVDKLNRLFGLAGLSAYGVIAVLYKLHQ